MLWRVSWVDVGIRQQGYKNFAQNVLWWTFSATHLHCVQEAESYACSQSMKVSKKNIIVTRPRYFFLMFIYLFWERQRETERDRENPKQATCTQCGAWSELIPWPWDHDLSHNRESVTKPTEPLRHPMRALYLIYIYIHICVCFLQNSIFCTVL